MSALTIPLIDTVADLEEQLSRPTPGVLEFMRQMEGDLLVLGVGGKMGPTLARMARRALDAAEKSARVIGVSRFSEPGLRQTLESARIETVACDLLDPQALAALPDVPNVVFMAGRKFGSAGGEALTWAMNAYLPGLVAQRYAASRIVVFSSGNVYPLSPVGRGGSRETDAPGPIGEYAQSCLARERVFEHISRQQGTPVVLVRLNYAAELRYGVILDVAQKVAVGEPVDLTMGHANVIWQGDACAHILQSFALCAAPPTILNVTGPETLSVRHLAERLGELLGKAPIFAGSEAETALLSNASRAFSRFGYPTVPLDHVIQWVAHWAAIGGPTLNKPTHFETRDGKF